MFSRATLFLPFVLPGLVVTSWLLRALRQGALPDALLALLLAVPILTIARWILQYVGWGGAGGGYTTTLNYGFWQFNLFIGPAYFLYFQRHK